VTRLHRCKIAGNRVSPLIWLSLARVDPLTRSHFTHTPHCCRPCLLFAGLVFPTPDFFRFWCQNPKWILVGWKGFFFFPLPPRTSTLKFPQIALFSPPQRCGFFPSPGKPCPQDYNHHFPRFVPSPQVLLSLVFFLFASDPPLFQFIHCFPLTPIFFLRPITHINHILPSFFHSYPIFPCMKSPAPFNHKVIFPAPLSHPPPCPYEHGTSITPPSLSFPFHQGPPPGLEGSFFPNFFEQRLSPHPDPRNRAPSHLPPGVFPFPLSVC